MDERGWQRAVPVDPVRQCQRCEEVGWYPVASLPGEMLSSPAAPPLREGGARTHPIQTLCMASRMGGPRCSLPHSFFQKKLEGPEQGSRHATPMMLAPAFEH